MPEQPKQIGAAPKDPVIYTIPEQFYGLAAKAQLPKDSRAIAAAPAPGAPAAVVPGPAPAPEKGSKAWILIPIIAVLLLGGIGFAAWKLLQPKPPASQPPSVTLPPATTPPPTPEPEPEPEPEPATTTPEVPPAPVPSADGDADGLTTSEETLFGTDMAKADTDGDGFSDSVEVMNLYNPAGFRPTKLVEAGLVTEVVAEASPFAVLSPAKWSTQVSNLPADDMFMVAVPDDSAASGERFTVRDGGELGDQSLLDAYLTRNPGTPPSQVQPFTTKSGLEGVRSPDGATAYIALDGRILIVSHERVSQPLFASTFSMFLNSFAKKP